MSRTLRFPDGEIRGRIYARTRTAAQPAGLLSDALWHRLGEATGTLTAPDDADLKLVINARHAQDLGWLAGLRDAAIDAIEIRGPAVDGEQLRQLAALPGLTAVALVTHEVAPSAIAALASMSRLRELRLGHFRRQASITVAALAPLATTALSDLQLYNVPLRGGALDRLAALTALRITRTAGDSTESGLCELGEPPALQHLDVAGVAVRSDDLAYIGRLTRLETVQLRSDSIAGHLVPAWQGLTRLRALWIDGLDSGDASIAGFCTPPALESLGLPGVTWSSRGLEALCRGTSAHLRTLTLDGGRFPAGGVPVLFTLAGLEELKLSQIESPTIDLTGIGKLAALRSLALDDVSGSVQSIEPLQEVPHLQALHLGGQPLRGATGVIGRLSRLQELSLDRCALVDTDITALGQLKHLRCLAVGGNAITDAAADAIAALGDLQELNLAATEMTDACLAALARLRQLRMLDLHGVPLTGERLGVLDALQALHYLRLGGVRASNLRRLGPLPSLHTLVLDRVELDGDAARSIAALPALQRLELAAGSISEDAARELARAGRLEALSLTAGSRVSDGAMAQLARLPALRSLDLSRSTIGDTALAPIRGMRALERIELRDTAVTAAGLQLVASVPSLDHISVAGSRVSAADIAALASRMPNCWYVA